jgi:hypothetical protein
MSSTAATVGLIARRRRLSVCPHSQSWATPGSPGREHPKPACQTQGDGGGGRDRRVDEHGVEHLWRSAVSAGAIGYDTNRPEIASVSIRLIRPGEDVLRQLLTDAAGDALTYAPVGMSGATDRPAGYRVDAWVRALGDAPQVWQQACEALSSWQVHRGAGLVVCADGRQPSA